MELIRGEAPEWALRDSGDGAGNGYGYGYGSGDGSGDGNGYGYGDGAGNGAGNGSGVISCSPQSISVGVATLIAAKACEDQVALFQHTFPSGATFPGDIDKARAAGLDLEWARKNLGLLLPV